MKKTIKYTLITIGFLFASIVLFNSKPVLAAQARGLSDLMIYNIENKNSGKYLNVNSATDTNGTNVNQWSNDGSIEQKFRIVYYSKSDAYRIYAMCSDKGAGRVVDVLKSNGKVQSGCNVDIWATGDDPCQFFEIRLESVGVYSIRLKSNSNLALTAYGTGNGSGAGTSTTSNGNVYISNYTGADSQKWKFNVYRIPPAEPYRNYRGISGQTYYIDSSCNNFLGHVNNGINSWKPTITLSQASSNSSTSIDFFGVAKNYYASDPSAPSDWIGHCDHWISSSEVDGIYKSWAYSIINLNRDEMVGSSLTSNQKKATVAHEMGHAYGLAHYDISGTIMVPSVSKMTVYEPSSIDRTAINLKY